MKNLPLLSHRALSFATALSSENAWTVNFQRKLAVHILKGYKSLAAEKRQNEGVNC